MQTQIYGVLLVVNTLINIVELPFTLYFLHGGSIYDESRCGPWIVVNYSLYQTSIYLMTWTSIERYLFIYQERLIKQHTIALHYGPIVAFCLYCPLLYIGLVFIYNCQPAYDVRLYICGGPCYSLVPAIGLFDWMGNGLLMETIILIVNVIVILRYSIQRHRMRSVILSVDARQQWVSRVSAFIRFRMSSLFALSQRRTARLVTQLLSVAILYVLGWYPYSIIVLVQLFQNSEQLAIILSTYFAYIPYIQPLLLPYCCIFFIPDIRKKLVVLLALFTSVKTNVGQNRIGLQTERHNTGAT